MSSARDRRRCALQVLYQIDAGGNDPALPADRELIEQALEPAAGSDRDHEDALVLAEAAWALREKADRIVTELAPDWPTYRQPVIDRNILRLAYHELTSELAPPKVVINEAVELAREFSTEKSPLFVNGVLDKIYRAQRGEDADADDATDLTELTGEDVDDVAPSAPAASGEDLAR